MNKHSPKKHNGRMAISYDLYQKLSNAIWKTLIEKAEAEKQLVSDIVAAYENGNFPNAAKTKDLNKRFRWDCFWAIPTAIRVEITSDPRFKDKTDDYLDTALKNICPQGLERKF